MMKRLFILILILCSLSGYGQTINGWLGTPGTGIQTRGAHYIDSAAYMPIRDTTWTPSRIGVIVFRSADLSYYGGISLTGQKWQKIGLGTPTLQQVTDAGDTTTNSITSTSTIKGGMLHTTDSRFLMGNTSDGVYAYLYTGVDIAQDSIGLALLSGSGIGRTQAHIYELKKSWSHPSLVGNTGGLYMYEDSLWWVRSGVSTNLLRGTSSSGGGSTYTPTITTSAATSLTLGTSYETYVFTGSSATTWTLPAISGDSGRRYFIKNRGTANITLQRAGTDQLYNTSLINSITILPGGSFVVQNDGTYWVVFD